MKATEYNQCVHEYADRLYRFAYRLLSDQMDAEDTVQVVFERLWKRHDQVKVEAVKSYLFTSVHRACIDQFRRRQTQRKATEQGPKTEPLIQQDDLDNRQLIEEGLKRLTAEQKSLVLMRDYEGYSYQEIADMTDQSLSQIKIKLFRARKKLQFFLIKKYC